METGSVTVMPFLLFSILRKVIDENENDWDDFFTAPCLPLTPKSQALPSLARSVYDVWSSTRLPLVLEQFMQKAENGEEINRLAATNIRGCFARLHRQDGYDKKCPVFQGQTQHNHSPGKTKKAVLKEEKGL